MSSRAGGLGSLCSERQGAAVRLLQLSSHHGSPLPSKDTGAATTAVLSLLLPEFKSTLSPWPPTQYLSTTTPWNNLVVPQTLRESGYHWDAQVLDPLWETSLSTTQKLKRDFRLTWNLGFARSEHRDLQFSSVSMEFPVPASYSLEEINEKEGVGEMDFATSHISVEKQGKVSRVYFISTAQEVSVQKTALIPASTACYSWHFCKLACKRPLGIP